MLLEKAGMTYDLAGLRTCSRPLSKGTPNWRRWVHLILFCLGVEGLNFNYFMQDIVSLDDFLQPMQELLPDLREEADQVLRELAQEEAAIEEVEQSDPDYLNDLKASLEEIK